MNENKEGHLQVFLRRQAHTKIWNELIFFFFFFNAHKDEVLLYLCED